MSNKNFKGSIELISGITPKNKGDFPLVDAEDVIIYEGEKDTVGMRLPDKLKALGISETEKQNIVNSVFSDSRFTNANNLISENKDNINKINDELKTNNELLKVQYEEAESMLYLFEGETLQKGEDGNVLASTIIKGGGGSSALSCTLSMQRIGERSLTFLRGVESVILNYRANLLNVSNSEPEGARLNFNIAITSGNGSVTTKTFQAATNVDLDYEVSEFLTLGDNIIKISTSYSEEIDGKTVSTSASTSWNIKIVNLEITSDFNDLIITDASREEILPITVKGDVNKTLYWSLNGGEFAKYENITSTQYTHNIVLPPQSHGTCSVEAYVSATVAGTEITSKSLYFDVMRRQTGNNKPIIRAVPKIDTREQYTTIPIGFYVYHNSINNPSIELKAVDEKGNQEFIQNRKFEIKEKEGQDFWYYTPTTSGKKVLTITCEDTVKTLNFDIKDFPFIITPPVSSGLELDFNPAGRTNQDDNYNEFQYNNITWQPSDNFNWKTGGWQVDKDNVSYFCVKAGTSVTFDYKMFANEGLVTSTGAEFKIIFKTTNVAKPNTTWLQCLAETEKHKTVGLQMDVHNGYVYSSLDTLKIPYSEEDVIEFDMNITPFNNNNEKNIPMIMTYEDGTPVQPVVLTDRSTTFVQEEPASIVIGSPDCDVHIYRMKAYSNFLTEKEILTNFIADAPSGTEKAKRFIRNQIYDSQGRLTPQSVAEACPDLRVVCITAPRFTKGKLPETGWDKVSDTTIEMIYKNGGPEFNWIAKNCQHTGQGTSSNGYGQAGRNIDLIMNKSGVDGKKPEIRLDGGQGDIVSKVALSETSVPSNYFNIKVNIASSENANNALLQKRYDRYLPYKTGTDVRDLKAKTTMEFFNCVIFVKETGVNTLTDATETKVEFDDGLATKDTEFHFYGIGNIGDSKKTDSSRTSDPDDPNEFCVEIMDWNRILATFPEDTMTIASKYNKKDDQGNITSYTFIKAENLQKTEDDPEPKLYEKQADGSYSLTQDTEIDIENIDKYYIDILENDDFSEDYTYGFRYLNDDEDEDQIAAAKAKWIEFYRFLTRDLTTNGVEDPSKVEEWKSEFKDWFIEDAAYFYYLYTLRYTMVDNRAKNSFWHYGKVATTNDEGQLVYATDKNGNYIYKFDFWDYDNDTSLGIDNAGKLEMDYGVEDNDLDPTVGGGDPDQSPTYFRGASSTFFQRLVKYFGSEVKRSYSTYETKNTQVFDSNHLIEEFDNWQSQFPEELWRLDYERKYKRPYVNGQGAAWDYAIPWSSADTRFLINMMNGKKKYQRRQFERNQDFYMSSKFIGMKNASDVITLRGAGDLSGATGLVIPQDTTLYITPYMNMYINLNSSNSGGTPYESGTMLKAGETKGFQYDPAAAGFDFNVIYGASKIQSLGDLSKMYLQQATLSKGVKLKEALLGNSTQGYSNENLTLLEITEDNAILEKLNIENLTKLTGSAAIDKNPNLKEFYAKGSKIESVTFAQGGLINTAELPESVNTLRMKDLFFLTEDKLVLEKPENLLELVIINTPNVNSLGLVSKAVNLTRVRLTDINWRISDAAILNRLLKCKGVAEDGETPIAQSVVTGNVYIENVRQSELDIFAKTWPELTITGWDNLIPQATVSFYNYNSSFLGSIKVDQGLSCPDPIATGVFALPTKPSSAQYDFQFAGWAEQVEVDPEYIVDITTQQISRDVQYYAQYGKELRQYTVEWYADDKTKLHSTQVYYGEPAVYSEIPTKSAYNNIIFYLFEKWDKPTGYITGDTKVSAVWAEANGATILNNIKDGTTTVDNLTPIEIYALAQYNAKEGFKTGDQISLQLGYMPTYSSDPEKERVLVEDLVLTGKNYQVFEDIELFAEDKDFVIAFDYTPAYLSTSATQTFLSCYQSGGTPKGFRVYNQNNKSILKLEPSAPTQNIHPTGHQASADTQYREIFVLRHKKGEEGLTLYRNNRYSMDPVDVVTLPNPGNSNYDPWYSGKHPLVIGAEYNGGNPINIAKGTIHYAKIWFSDIGDDECRNICKWIYDTMTFDYVGADRYYYPEGSGISKASFIATDLLDQARFIFNERGEGRKQGGWKETDLRMWMNNKLFSGVSLIWQQIISKVTVASLQATESGYDNAELRKVPSYSDNYFYLPSICEVTSNPPTFSGDNIFAEELKGLNVETYPIFGNNTENSSRVKYLNGVPAFWWLRSPYYNSDSTNGTLSYWNAVVLDGRVLNSPSVQITTGTSSTTYTLSNYSSFGICPCFSI